MKEKLFNDFPPVSAKAWKQKIQYELKGADYNQNMVYESLEGIQIKPFYHADDLKRLSQNQPSTPHSWAIGQEIFVANAKKANTKALDALHRGAESLLFTIPSEEISIKVLLQDIDLTKYAVHFNLQFLSKPYIESLLRATQDYASQIYLNIDIIGNLARSGNWHVNQKKDFSELNEILHDHKPVHALGIDATLYQNAGANMVQELAYTVAHANEYLNHLDTNLFQGATFKISVGTNYFFEIAKLRALRLLWQTLTSEYGQSKECYIIATPSKRDKTVYDYNTNLLRTTTASMSSVLGGADLVCNMPYDFIYKKDHEFSERLARNQLLILKNESHFDEARHASEGTYYIETLTYQLAQKALTLFKNIESGGGLLQQLKKGTLQQKIRESAQKEQQWFDENKKILVGTNAFQEGTDTMKSELERYPFVKKHHRKTLIIPIIEKRLAETIEQERLKGEE